MAVRLKCHACHDSVIAEESGRGSTVRCGTCGADVPVPTAEVPPPPARPVGSVPVAKAVPLPPGGSGITVAKALPLSPVPAKPVPAKPVTRYPTIDDGSRSDRDVGRRASQRRYEDDDDRPVRQSSSGGGGKVVLIALVCLGLFIMLGGGIAAVVLLSGTSNTETVATDPDPADFHQDESARVNPQPSRPRGGDFDPNQLAGGQLPAPRGATAGWQQFRAGGFSLLAPAGVTKHVATVNYNGKFLQGTRYDAKAGNDLELDAQELELLDGVPVNDEGFVAAATSTVKAQVRKTGGRPLPHGFGTEFSTGDSGFAHGSALVTATADKVFVFHIRWKDSVTDGTAKRDAFFDSVRITAGGNNPLGPGQPPGGPGRITPITTPWKPVANSAGFVAEGPPGMTGEKQTLELEDKKLVSGMKYHADDGSCQYWLFHHDVPADRDDHVEKIARKLVHEVFPHEIHGSESGKLDGKPATKWTIRHFHGGLSTGYSVKLGYRVFTLFVTSKQGIYQLNGDPTLEERQKKFFDAVRLPFDPKTFDPYADEPKWVPLAQTNGFSVLVPKNATVVKDRQVGFGFGPDVIPGKEYTTDVDGITYQVTAHTANERVTTEKIATDLRGREAVRTGPDKVTENGMAFEHYELSHFFGHPILFRSLTVGKSVITLRVVRSDQFGKQVGDKEFQDKAAKFFNSFRLGNVPGGEGVAASGRFAQLAAGKVTPFWAAAFLPQAKELITVGVLDPNGSPPGGVLRRYSVPEFQLKATYHLTHPAHRAVADERSGKLYLASVASAADAKLSEREAAIVAGEIQVYDLKTLLGGSVGELQQVKPTSSLFVGAQVSGLAVAPGGEAVYVSCVQTGGTRARPTFRGKLIKFDPVSGKGTDLALVSPVWAMELAADGRRLAAVERPVPAVPGRGGNLVLVDAPSWKTLKSIPLNGEPLDVTFLGARASALNVSNGTLKLTSGGVDGEATDIDLPGDVRYIRAGGSGQWLLASAGMPTNGLTLFATDGGKTPKLTGLASAQELDGAPVGGVVTVSPDGKLAVLNTGVVLDLPASGAK